MSSSTNRKKESKDSKTNSEGVRLRKLKCLPENRVQKSTCSSLRQRRTRSKSICRTNSARKRRSSRGLWKRSLRRCRLQMINEKKSKGNKSVRRVSLISRKLCSSRKSSFWRKLLRSQAREKKTSLLSLRTARKTS